MPSCTSRPDSRKPAQVQRFHVFQRARYKLRGVQFGVQFHDLGAGMSTPDTRVMIEGRQGSPGSRGRSQASQGDLSSPESREFVHGPVHAAEAKAAEALVAAA